MNKKFYHRQNLSIFLARFARLVSLSSSKRQRSIRFPRSGSFAMLFRASRLRRNAGSFFALTGTKGNRMRKSSILRFAPLGFLAAILGTQVGAQPPTPEIFATGHLLPQGIVPSGANFIIVNTNGKILSVPATGGVGTLLTNIPIPPATSCTTVCLSLRDGAILPDSFGPLAGKFLVVGGQATTNTPAYASTVDNTLTVTPYATQPSSLWSAAVVVTGFGHYNGGVLVTNQGSGRGLRDGSVDFFAPDGGVQPFAALPDAEVPYGAALAPDGFGDVAGDLLVSDARSGRIYSINPNGKVQLFATVPLVAGLRQIAFAPQGWGRYTHDLFVSVVSGEVVVLDQKGNVAGKITGFGAPRSLRFANVNGVPSLLVGETSSLQLIYRVGPEHIVPAP
jgi:hypothetical protein